MSAKQRALTAAADKTSHVGEDARKGKTKKPDKPTVVLAACDQLLSTVLACSTDIHPDEVCATLEIQRHVDKVLTGVD
jgi:hypothetical protein